MKILGFSSYSNEHQYGSVRDADNAISDCTERAQQNSDYGKGLDTLLIFYNFETEPDEFAGTDFLQKKIKVNRYNSKEKSLRINVFVGYDELTNKTYEEQITFYFNTTMQALEMVREMFTKRKNPDVEVDFEKLQNDIRKGLLEAFDWLC